MPIEAVEQFSGYRLSSLLQERNWSQIRLSKETGISRSAISEYCSGKKPSYDTLEKIANVLDVPIHFFVTAPASTARLVGPKLYRAYSGKTQKAAKCAEARLEWVAEAVEFCERRLLLPKPTFLNSYVDINPSLISDNEIEAIARNVRIKLGFGDGPVRLLLRTLEAAGLIVFRFEGLDIYEDTVGISTYSSSERAFIALTASKAHVRDNFSLAHELGHLILHRMIPGVNVDNPTYVKKYEAQANRFAGAFLLPSPTFENSVFASTLTALRMLKSKWNVSISAMIRRLFDLNIIAKDRYTSLCIQLSQRGWRKNEPLDDTLPIEEPILLKKAFNQLLDKGIVSPEQITSELPFRDQDLEQITRVSIEKFHPSRAKDRGRNISFPDEFRSKAR